jgi:exopolysaccharide biosynthesis polyprenyl glycosylphosphotransferase
MTMAPPAASHTAPRDALLAPRRVHSRAVARLCGRLATASHWGRVQLVSDAVTLYLAAGLAAFADPSIRGASSSRWLAAVFPLLVTAIMRARRSPDERLTVSLLDTFTYVLAVVSFAAMLMLSVNSILGGHDSVGLSSRLWAFSAVYLGIARAVLVSIRRQATQSGEVARPTLIVGAGMIGAHLVRRLLENPVYGLRPVGFLDSDPLVRPDGSPGMALPVLGGPGDLGTAIAQTGARHVILAFSGERDHDLIAKVRQCEAAGVGVSLIPRLYEAINERTTLDHVGGLPLLTLHAIDPRGWQFAVKHAFDRTFALVGLIAASPIMLAIVVAVRLSSPGPVLFRQRRVGRDGREFDVLKFRTMFVADPGTERFQPAAGCAPGGVEGIDRRTRVGRVLRDLSLDELPQLINVLRGDMSLVGPRPERPEYVARFVHEVARYEDRHRVKSGITGWAQVHGLRGQTSVADRVEWDNYYVRNWSLRLDLRILAFTISEILRFRG